MARLIVHADDFGLTEMVNAGIFKAYKEGFLTSTSIMAVGEGYEHAIEIAGVEAGLDVGVHLTLIEEKPLLPAHNVRSLVTGGGRFPADAFLFFKRYCCGKIKIVEVYRELDAQICKVLESGIKVSHLDSHQHLHMLPGVLQVTLRLARKYNIKAIRFPGEKIKPLLLWKRPAPLHRVLLSQFLRCFCIAGRKKELIPVPDFYGFINSGSLKKEDVVRILKSLPDKGTAELMCHPGLDDPKSPYHHWNYRWQEELDVLLNPELPSLLRKLNVTLISYRDIAGQ